MFLTHGIGGIETGTGSLSTNDLRSVRGWCRFLPRHPLDPAAVDDPWHLSGLRMPWDHGRVGRELEGCRQLADIKLDR